MTVTWWCSFVDPARPEGERFVGLLLIDMPAGATVDMVARTAWAQGLNPGGEMLAYEWSEVPVPAKFKGRLLTAEDARYVDEWMSNAYAEQAVRTPDELRAQGRVIGEGQS